MDQNFAFKVLPKNLSYAESFDVYLCNSYSLPSFAIKFLKEESELYKARDDDIYVVSFPKTGTAWLQQIIYLVNSDLDLETAKKSNLHELFPYIEHAMTDYDAIKNMKSPRLLKTHLPYSLLPSDIHKRNCKLIYITRNPRDVAVSYYHFACMLKETQYKGSFEQFFERFFHDRTTYSPFLLHNLEFWRKKDDSNVLFLFYEDLKKDLAGNVRKIADFLGKFLTSENVNMIVEHCSFKSMAKNESFALPSDLVVDKKAKYFRKGEVGDWRNYFNEEMIMRLDKKINEMLNDSGLEYTYNI